MPVTDNLIQPLKQDLAAMQQFTTVPSTTAVASDQGAQASAAAAISGGMGGAVSQTGSLLLQPGGPVNLNLEAPLGTRDWGEAVGERILWMVGRTIQGATLRITPPHLGSIDIQLTMQQDQTSVSFTTQNGAVREALEAAIPRLREMFGESNLQLANVDVSQRQAEDQRGMSGNEGRDKGNGPEMGEDGHRGMVDSGDEPTSPNTLADSNSDRLLDYYA
jgi:flagellar hook-length control protein FliK